MSDARERMRELGRMADRLCVLILSNDLPAVDIEKDTNGNQADTIAAQDSYSVGDAVTWTFVRASSTAMLGFVWPA